MVTDFASLISQNVAVNVGTMASAEHRDGFLVAFQGRTIRCVTIRDATAIKSADRMLGHWRSYDSPVELKRLAGVLSAYGCQVAADAFNNRAIALQDALE